MDVALVNTFTATPFSGNPATVCIPHSGGKWNASDVLLQRIASEVAHVEVAFVLPPQGGKADFSLRFFTKKQETPFCGHALLAAAHILWERGFKGTSIYFSTQTGTVVATRTHGKFIELDLFPTLPKRLELNAEQLARIAAALRLPGGSHAVAEVLVHPSSKNLILVLASVQELLAAKPSIEALIAAAPEGVSKVTITARLGKEKEETLRGYDFVTRLFAPWIGIDEDAVSGASHAVLAAYWGQRPELSGRTTLKAYQASRRGGELLLELRGTRVGVAGEAVTVQRGSLVCSPALSRVAKL